MAKLSVKQIHEEAKKLLADHPSGLRFTQLVAALAKANPDTNENTIYTSVSKLSVEFPKEVIKPSRGIYQLASLADQQGDGQVDQPPARVTRRSAR